uniref:Uncharacterized protein n=1 Tax=Anguilla anguilla TaxID=7936 RepID=A0A0E9P9L7_ANGAN
MVPYSFFSSGIVMVILQQFFKKVHCEMPAEGDHTILFLNKKYEQKYIFYILPQSLNNARHFFFTLS